MPDLAPTGEYDFRPLPVDDIAYRFEKDFRAGRSPRIDDFLTGEGLARWQLLVELIHRELELRLQAGEPARLSDYLERYPALAHAPNDLAALLETEVRFRLQAKEDVSLAEYQLRYALLEHRVREVFQKVGSAPPEVPGYDQLEELARGGMGVVYRARQILLKRAVALKVIRRDRLADGEQAERFRARFQREAEAVAAVSHPNVVQIFETGVADGDLFLAMELIDGPSLQKHLDTAGVLAPRMAAELVEKAARAIAEVHARGIIHRDLKPDNILMTAAGEPKVVDFGLAKPTDLADGRTKAGMVLGTPEYMSPEQAALTGEDPTPRVDVYGLGAVLYAALTGRPPFPRASILETLEKVRTQLAVPIRELRPEAPADLETICRKCLEKDPGRRYDSAAALADDLRRYLDGKPIVARPVGMVEWAGKWVKRNPVITGSALAVVLALTVGTVVSYLKYRDAREQEGIAIENEGLANRKATEAEIARKAEADRVIERDAALDEARYQLGIGSFLLANAAYENRNVGLARDRLDQVPVGQQGWEWHYLRQQAEGGLFALYGHSGLVWGVAYSPDGARLATAGHDGTARVWDARSGAQLRELRGHAGAVTAVAFSPDGARLTTAGGDGTVRVWDARTGAAVRTLKGHAGVVTGVAYSPDGARLATTSEDRTARVWDARTGAPLLALKEHADQVTAVAFSPDGVRLATASLDKTARVWDARTGAQLLELNGHSGRVTGVAYSPDGSRLATASYDQTARVWDARTGAQFLELRGHAGRQVTGVAYSPDGARVATAGMDGTARVWDARSGDQLLELIGHPGPVTGVAYDPDGARVATVGMDGTGRVWATWTGTPVLELKGHASAVAGVVFSPDGARLASAGWDRRDLEDMASARQERTVRVWDARTGALFLELKGNTGPATGVAYSPDGARLATAGEPRTARLWDARTGAQLRELKGHAGPVTAVAFSPDGAQVATASRDRTARVWDARTGAQLREFKGHMAEVVGVAWSPDGARLATAGWDGTARVWDARSGAQLREFRGHRGLVTGVAYSPDGARVATAGMDGTARVWDARSGDQLLELKAHPQVVWGVAYSPDGSRLATAGMDKTARVWDARTGAPLLELTGHAGQVTGVTFSPDGARLATASTDKTVRVWHAKRGRELKGEPIPPIQPGDRSPDGRVFAYRDDDRVRLIRMGLDFNEEFDHLFWTRPNLRDHLEQFSRAVWTRSPIALGFHLDRLLSYAPADRPKWLAKRTKLQADHPVLTARTAIHSPTIAKAGVGPLALRAAYGDALALRLIGGLCIRNGEPDKAVGPLTMALALRPPDRPPVEELLLALAHAKAGRLDEAKAWHAKAVAWLDRYQRPMQVASAVGTASTAGWGGAVELFREQTDPRDNPFDWETWYECQVFRTEVEATLRAK